MSSEVSSSSPPPSTLDSISNENRPSTNFHPSLWGDIFLSTPTKMNIESTIQSQCYEKLKQEVRSMLLAPVDELYHKLCLIDTIERLGVSYHFEREIEDALQKIYGEYKDDNNLETSSLLFRLLREHGFNVQCEAFNKFKDDEVHFKESLTSDVKGLLELYDACHLRMHGENVLEEALAFTTSHLQCVEASISYPLSVHISHALKRSNHKRLPRLQANQYIYIYQNDTSHDKTLLQFAKLDFNLLQSLHKEELSKISRWWKDLDFAKKLPFARDRLVECYFWILGVYFEPQYSFGREILTKAIIMASTMDDIFDAYGTFQELQLFTNAIESWDTGCTDQLPPYMKFFYNALSSIYKEMKEVLSKQGESYRVQYAKEAMMKLCKAYFVEAKWYHEKYVPTVEEYITNGSISSGYIMVGITSLVGMGEIVTKDIFEWASSNPKIVKASSIIARFMDDIVSHKFEQERGHVASAVECYMKQHGVTEEDACSELNKQVENAWKDINEEMVKPTAGVPMEVLKRILNLARVIDFLYKEGDGYTHVGDTAKAGISSLLIDPIPI